ncbi:piggyBac transposable element-derived protein 4-like [Dendropsophus ebraccatus]|uniref:piggyBac transposable element-derived protein 4-like n=1 Tax=Dendropsophus ebraccatus TaxID=150705 RepID=UPI0038315A1A
MAVRVYSAEEAYAMLASDSETLSAEDLDYLLSSSSSSLSDNEEPPRQRRRLAARDPHLEPITDWSPPTNYTPQIPAFTATAGVHAQTEGLSELDFFQLFFSADLLQLMVEQTNLYAEQFIAAHPNSFLAQPNRWHPTNCAELLKYWGLVLNMGLNKKTEVRSYWSTDVLYHCPLYRNTMTRPRFEALQKFLHFSDNSQCPPQEDPRFDRLNKIRPVINILARNFSSLYTPKKEISVDESLVSFKGRVKFRQYLPNKRAQYGLKLYKLCESDTAYMYAFRVYEGKDSHIDPPGCPSFISTSGKIAWDLLRPLFDQGYHLYLDNWYTSVPLFKCLLEKKTVACGTVRKNQKHLPKTLINQRLTIGESRALLHDGVLCLKYRDKKDVCMLTSIHDDASTSVPRRGFTSAKMTPVCIQAYNKFMGGVDLNDQILKPYSAMRRSRIWYKKLAVNLVQMALYNSFVLYRKAGNHGTYLEYQEKVIKRLILGEEVGETSASSSNVGRIIPGQHFPGLVPCTGKKRQAQKRCRVCFKKGIRRDTIYQCDTCPSKPGLCMKECFRIFHTSLD